jgi:hypothetical protein
MGAPELKAALEMVGQDHQLVLDKMQALKEAVNGLLDSNGTGPRRALDRLRDLNRYFVTQFANHLEEEEVGLFPLLERDEDGGPDLVARLRREHTDIRRRLEDFGNCLDVAAQLDAPPMAVRRDLVVYGWDFLEAMGNHALLETQAVGRCVARSLAG